MHESQIVMQPYSFSEIILNKLFDCNKCDEAHERPINSKCLKVSGTVSENQCSSDIGGDMGKIMLILQELKSL